MTILILIKKSYLLLSFDKNDNHVSGELKPIAFDKIQDFIIDKQDSISLFSNPENRKNLKLF
jgi:uncharacterized phage-like protein YoqJ